GNKPAVWKIPAHIGRRYARVAGDYNPIHLGAPTARLFGFRAAIATGMWLAARSAAAINVERIRYPHEFTVEFKRPVYLPAEPLFSRKDGDDVKFALYSEDKKTCHLKGSLVPLDPPS